MEEVKNKILEEKVMGERKYSIASKIVDLLITEGCSNKEGLDILNYILGKNNG
jgi:hypothetical protein